MKSMFVNTSTKKTIVAIVVDDEIKYLYKEDATRSLSIDILNIIDEGLKAANMTVRDIETIYVTNGPGSFTGIRIGLTVIKTMAWGLKMKVVPVSSLEFMASKENDDSLIVPLIDARRDYVYGAAYDSNLNPVIEDSYILFSELKEKIGDRKVTYVSQDSFDVEVEEPEYNILKMIEKHKNDEGINPHRLNPNYLKSTEAEEKLKGSGC